MLDRRAKVLRAALGFLALEPRAPELRVLHRWLDTWPGIGHVVAGMARHGYAWAPSPWQAMQRAAAETLHRLEFPEPAPRDWTLTDESPR